MAAAAAARWCMSDCSRWRRWRSSTLWQAGRVPREGGGQKEDVSVSYRAVWRRPGRWASHCGQLLDTLLDIVASKAG